MLIDSHCHLFDPRYNKTISEIFNECVDNGVTKLINIGTHISDCNNALEVVNEFDYIYTSLGIFPHEDKDLEAGELVEKLRVLLNGPYQKKVVAIGECGIDILGWENARSLEKQIELFEAQINLAVEFNLPIIIHDRNGDDRILDLLNKYKNKPLTGVLHGIPSDRTWETCKKFLDLGYYLSFGGSITYPSNNDLRDIVKKTPDDMFLLETDSPYLPPQGHRGEVNHPKYVRIVAEKASQIKEKPFEETCRLSYNNTCRLFKI